MSTSTNNIANMVALGAVAAATAGILLIISNRNQEELEGHVSNVKKKVQKIMKTSSSKERHLENLHSPQNFVFRHECIADRTFGTLNEATGK